MATSYRGPAPDQPVGRFGGINLSRPPGMDYSGKFRTGPANFQPGRPVSVGQYYSQMENRPNAMYADGSAVPQGMPIHVAGWKTSGYGPQRRIGSPAGAVGSPGIPTSQIGKAMKYGVDPMTGEGAYQKPTWALGQQQRDQYGLAPSMAYGDMGRLPYSSAAPIGSTPGSSPKPADSSTSTKPDPWAGRTSYKNPQAPMDWMTPKQPMGIPSSLFGTSIQDMINRQYFMWK
jgi:hypothetical protein